MNKDWRTLACGEILPTLQRLVIKRRKSNKCEDDESDGGYGWKHASRSEKNNHKYHKHDQEIKTSFSGWNKWSLESANVILLDATDPVNAIDAPSRVFDDRLYCDIPIHLTEVLGFMITKWLGIEPDLLNELLQKYLSSCNIENDSLLFSIMHAVLPAPKANEGDHTDKTLTLPSF